MARRAYIATVQLLIEADSEGDACDTVIALLSELPDNGILDWSYLPIGGQLLSPKEKIIANTDQYEEGDFLIA